MKLTNDEMKEFQRLLSDSRNILFRKLGEVEGLSIEELCPPAELIIQKDSQLSDEKVLSSHNLHFGGNLRKDALFVRTTPDSEYPTLIESVWSLIYISISEMTSVGPYVVQIPNFEIRLNEGVRTLHRSGWHELIWNGVVTARGAVLLHWLHGQGELPDGGEKFVKFLDQYLPEQYEKKWQDDLK